MDEALRRRGNAALATNFRPDAPRGDATSCTRHRSSVAISSLNRIFGNSVIPAPGGSNASPFRHFPLVVPGEAPQAITTYEPGAAAAVPTGSVAGVLAYSRAGATCATRIFLHRSPTGALISEHRRLIAIAGCDCDDVLTLAIPSAGGGYG